MKTKILSSLTLLLTAAVANAQVTTYAITGAEKGRSSWSEVKLIDVATGEVLKTVYTGASNFEILNARTGKAVVKKEPVISAGRLGFRNEPAGQLILKPQAAGANQDPQLKSNLNVNEAPAKPTPNNWDQTQHRERFGRMRFRYDDTPADQPFSTNSAACAYDKKHDRLYYTPLGINQLRYIDLKAKNPTIYYFEEEPFGALSSRRDIGNQVTRMVIGENGNGYALTNNSDHLIQFSTKKKAEVTDLGSLNDDPANGINSIHSKNGYGGDMVAGNKGGFYVITANRSVFKIDAEKMLAKYLGSITGLPAGYTTNGAAVEKGSSIIVSSANATSGYYRFDINTLAAEKIPNNGTVFNASDLANSTLVAEKRDPETIAENVVLGSFPRDAAVEEQNKISVYPNPAKQGSTVALSFKDQPKGKYIVQLLDAGGKSFSSKTISVSNKSQMESFILPELSGSGNFLLKVINSEGKVVSINKMLIQ